MGNVPSTSTESVPDDVLVRSLESQASLVGAPLTPANNKFLRTLRCRRAGETDLTLVKVFFVKNLDLSSFREKLKLQKSLLRLDNAPNVLAYQRFRDGGGSTPAFVSRQYLTSNLKDRLSTRPFLTDVEKLWIAYCLLMAGKQMHLAGIAHGDIKSENLMITSWGWPILTDLASFKPTFLQADQSAAPFNFFFSTGRKRCYIAPERFLSSSSASGKSSQSRDAQKRRFSEAMASKDTEIKKVISILSDAAGVPRATGDEKDAMMAQTALKTGQIGADADLTLWRRDINEDLLPSMDVFSIGCVLLELFNADGEAAFELSDALQFASKGESPRLKSLLGKIPSPSLRDMVESMTDNDPAKRLSLDSYLKMFTPTVFPESFTFLYEIMRSFVTDASQEGGAMEGPIEELLVWRTCERYRDICTKLLGVVDTVGGDMFENFIQSRHERDITIRSSAKAPTSAPSKALKPAANVGQSDDAQFDAIDMAIRELEQKLSSVSKMASFYGNNALGKTRVSAPVEIEEEDLLRRGVDGLPGATSTIAVISYLCMCIQCSQRASTRVLALLLTERLSRIEGNSELILARIIPFVSDRLQDSSAWVRCAALRTLSGLLEAVHEIPPSECKVFLDYLLPSLAECGRDASESVRVTFASCLPSLATSAKRFFELARESSIAISPSPMPTISKSTGGSDSMILPVTNYDAEMTALHDAVQKLMERTVATDYTGGRADLAIKQGLVSRIMPLCLFFGRDRMDRWLLPWLLSFLNARGPGNWRLQVAILDSLASIGALVGDEAFFQYLYPLIEDMLGPQVHDLVVESAARCLTSLVRMNLLRPLDMFKLVKRVGPFVRHPSVRVKRSAVLLLAAISTSKILPHVDVQLFVAEKLKPLFSPKNNNEAERFIVLLGKPGNSLESNAILLEQCLNTESMVSMAAWLQEYFAKPSANLSVTSTGAAGVAGKPARASSAASSASKRDLEATKDLKALVRVHVLKTNESMGTPSGASMGQSQVQDFTSLRVIRNRYGIVLDEYIPPRSLLRRAIALGLPETKMSLGRLRSGDWSSRPVSPTQPASSPSGETPPPPISSPPGGPVPSPAMQTTGGELSSTLASRSMIDWRPKGLLVSSFHEHAGPVNKVAVSDDFSFIVTGSDDCTAKVWRTDKLDRNPCPRSRVTFEAQGGRVVDVCSVRASTSVALVADTGRVNVVRVDAAQPEAHKTLKADSISRLVAVACASVNELVACSDHGVVFRWDLRSGARVNEISLLYGFGSVSCMAVSPDGSWLALGTHRGVVALIDLRLDMLIAAWRHPCSCAINRLYCPRTSEGLPLVYVAAGPNQAVLLNVQTGETRSAFACAPAEVTIDKAKLAEWKISQDSVFCKKYEAVDLDSRQLDRYIQEAKFASSSVHSSAFSTPHPLIRAFYCPADLFPCTRFAEPTSVLTAGTDMTVRYWDCSGAHLSSMVTAPPDEPKCKWECRDLNGKQGMVYYSLSAQRPTMATPSKSKGKFVVRPAHQDAILDMAGLRMPSDGSPHLITAGRDNIVRIWK